MPQDGYEIPDDASWVIRTYADRAEAWKELQTRIAAPVGPSQYRAQVQFIDDPKYYGLAGIELVHALPDAYSNGYCFLADGNIVNPNLETVTLLSFDPDSLDPADYARPPSAVPDAELRSIRLLPEAVGEIDDNLSIANIDMDDILNSVSRDGVYRGLGQ